MLILGGSFDPVHMGHINIALTIQKLMHFENFIFLPCKNQLLKKNIEANSTHRVAMLRLALMPYKDFSLDLREIESTNNSYTVDTLESFRRELGDNIAITWVLGWDAFLTLPKWHKWKDLINLANFLVVKRTIDNIQKISEPLKNLLAKNQTNNYADLKNISHGKIACFDAGLYNISSSLIRDKIKQKKDFKNLVPDVVYKYIKQHGLYEGIYGNII